MKKSKLLEQNMSLFSQLDRTKSELSELKKDFNNIQIQLEQEKAEKEELKSKIAELNAKVEQNSRKTDTPDDDEICENDAEASKNEEEKIIDNFLDPTADEVTEEIAFKEFSVNEIPASPNDNDLKEITLSDDLQYAADAISELVIESAKYSNELTAGGETRYKELVNLILGKTEVSKAEILSFAQDRTPFDIKKAQIDVTKKATLDYYKSVMAQR